MQTAHTLPCLFIPDDSALDQPVRQLEVQFPAGASFDQVLRDEVLHCQWHDSDVIYSQYHEAVFDGRDDRIPHGKEFAVYEAYMDDNGTTRPYSKRAAEMLLRPKSHGPMIVTKTSCVLDKRTGEIIPLGYEPVSAGELDSRDFRDRRRRFTQKELTHQQRQRAFFESQGGIVVGLD